MEKKKSPDFIVIDDDFISNIICKKVIENELPGTSVDIFTNSKKGLEYIDTTYPNTNTNNAVIFLDINMPGLSGWDILDSLKSSSESLKQHLKIFVFSSFLTSQDKQKVADDPLISSYIEKPLTFTVLRNIIGKL